VTKKPNSWFEVGFFVCPYGKYHGPRRNRRWQTNLSKAQALLSSAAAAAPMTERAEVWSMTSRE
jgi:hypothetical protein